MDELPGPEQQLWGFLLLSRGSFIYPSHWGTGASGSSTSPAAAREQLLGMKGNTFNSSSMTRATVERVNLGPVMLVPHEAGYDVPQ